MKKILLLLLFITIICEATETYIISDYDYTNQDYTFQQVWKFVKSYNNNPLTYDEVETIIRYCIVFEINPIMALARLQFESDLLVYSQTNVSVIWLKHRAMGYGLNHHIRRDGLKMYKYGGFDIQVYFGIKLMRTSFDSWCKGKKKSVIDLDKNIIPENASTYGLYVYTPFYGKHNVYNWKNDAMGVKAFETLIPSLKKRWNKIND